MVIVWQFAKFVLKDEYESTKVIVPGKTLNEISKILTGDNEKEVQIFFGCEPYSLRI